MADNDELDIKISELDAASDIDPAVDYLVVSKTSSIYTTGHKSFKATPNQVMASAGIGTLEGLSDVDLSSPTSGQVLKYDGSKWINGTGGSAVGDLDDLSDVDITTPTDGQALIYDSANDKWINGAGGGGSSTLSGLTDVTITAPSNNQVLKYDSTAGKWVNGTGGGGGASSLDDLSDVAITSATNDDSLVYNSTDDEWQNKPITKSLTQAEYDALVSGGTVDPNITYFITDGVPNGQMHNYSLAEHIVGSWIDGSTLYEKTIDFGADILIAASSWTTTSASATGISAIINCFGTHSDGSFQGTLLAYNNSDLLQLQMCRNSNSNVRYVTLQYTKFSS